jgi:hypothetical protein
VGVCGTGGASGKEFKGTIIAPGWTSASGVETGYKFIKNNYQEGDKIFMYAYSYGVDVAVDLATKLASEKIMVNLLLTVDGSDGIFQNSTVNKIIPANVNLNLNIFQLDDSGTSSSSWSFGQSSSNSSQSSSFDSSTFNFPGSNGSYNFARNSAQTNVINLNVGGPGVNHGNIQQKNQVLIEGYILNQIK